MHLLAQGYDIRAVKEHVVLDDIRTKTNRVPKPMLAFIGLNPYAQDALQIGGLLIAAVMVVVLAVQQLRATKSASKKTVLSIFCVLALIGIVYASSTPIARYQQRLKIGSIAQSLAENCASVDAAQWSAWGFEPRTELSQTLSPLQYDKLTSDSKKKGGLIGDGDHWNEDGRLVDPWNRPYKIGIIQESNGTRRIYVSSFGPDGIDGTVDDVLRYKTVTDDGTSLAAAPASPFAGWNTPDALRGRLSEKVELSQIGSDGGAGPPTSPWSQATELTARGAGPKDLLGALRAEVLARVQKSSWSAAEPKDGSFPDSFELAYNSGDHRGRITVRITSPVTDHFRIEVGGEEK